MDYEHQPLLSHATGRRTWIWTRFTPEWEKLRALQTSAYVIVTVAQDKIGFMESLRRKFKGSPNLPPDPIWQTWPSEFQPVFASNTFSVFKVKVDSFLKR